MSYLFPGISGTDDKGKRCQIQGKEINAHLVATSKISSWEAGIETEAQSIKLDSPSGD